MFTGPNVKAIYTRVWLDIVKSAKKIIWKLKTHFWVVRLKILPKKTKKCRRKSKNNQKKWQILQNVRKYSKIWNFSGTRVFILITRVSNFVENPGLTRVLETRGPSLLVVKFNFLWYFPKYWRKVSDFSNYTIIW